MPDRRERGSARGLQRSPPATVTLLFGLLAAATASAQTRALHTAAPEGTKGYVVSLGGSGEVSGSPAVLSVPPGTVTAQWQLWMKGNVRYLLALKPVDAHPNRFRFISFVGTNPAQASATPVTWEAGVEGAQAGTTGGILSSNVGFPTAFTLGAVRTGDLRWVLVFGTGPSGARVISVLEHPEPEPGRRGPPLRLDRRQPEAGDGKPHDRGLGEPERLHDRARGPDRRPRERGADGVRGRVTGPLKGGASEAEEEGRCSASGAARRRSTPSLTRSSR